MRDHGTKEVGTILAENVYWGSRSEYASQDTLVMTWCFQQFVRGGEVKWMVKWMVGGVMCGGLNEEGSWINKC